MTPARISSANALALWLTAVVAVVFFLRAARQLLIPIALAVLISYALEPVVSWLARHRLPRIAGSSLVMLVLLGAGAEGAYVLRDEMPCRHLKPCLAPLSVRGRRCSRGSGWAVRLSSR